MALKIPFNDDWTYNDSYDALPQGQYVRIPHTVAVTPFNYFDESVYQKISGYRKEFEFPKDAEGKRVFIVFEGVAHKADVFVNGKEVVSHGSGYTAFEADITDHLKKDILNELKVRVDSNETLNIPPFGFVIDYMTYGGIYREVSLEIRSENYIKDVFERGSAAGKLELDVTFAKEKCSYDITLTKKDSGEKVFSAEGIEDVHYAGKIEGISKLGS